MKMWSRGVIILLLFCYASLTTGNGRVRFVSMNFNNVLHWDPAEPSHSEEKVFYTVKYWSDVGKHHQIKKECQNITALTCDLTAETPSVHDVHYYAMVVLANGSELGRNLVKFKPIAETTLGAPSLTILPTPSSLLVNVTLPLGPNGVSVEDIIRSSKSGPSKTMIVYTLKITEPEWAVQTNENDNGQFVMDLKNNDTKYCGYVVYTPFSEWGREVSEKESFCATLPGNPHMYFPWIYAGAALLVAIVMASLGWMCHYVKSAKKSSMPPSLVMPSAIRRHVMQSPNEHMEISSPVIGDSHLPTDNAELQFKRKVSAVGIGGYSPQDMPFPAWQGSAGSSPGSGASSPHLKHLEVSGQSLDIYSAVTGPEPAEEEEEGSRQANTETCDLPEPFDAEPWENGGPKVPPYPDGDACEDRPLLLQVVRVPNGKLMLHSLGASPPHSQNKPCLSDLIEGPLFHSFDSSGRSDSEYDDGAMDSLTPPYCNSSYIASQTVPDFQQQCGTSPTFQSGYKQNWMPAILQDATDSCENRGTNYQWSWTLPKAEEEEGGGDEDGGSRPIVLGSWVVQIQD